MSPALIWLIAELTKLVVQRVSDAGKFNSLTEAEAEKMVLDIGASLSTSLPTPEELENPPNPL